MANIDENFVVKTGLTVGTTVITAATGNVQVGSTVINGTTGDIHVGPTVINGTTGAISTTANVNTTGNFIANGVVLSPTGGSFSNATVSSSTINNTPIGGTTAASGKFTTLDATGTITTNDILPHVTNVSNIGSDTQRFNTIFVNEAKLSTNTLYLGDTPILGTANNVINIHADTGQSISMQTSGAAGNLGFVSNAQITMQTTGNNADVLIQSNGTGSETRLLSAAATVITAPAVNINGTVTTTGNETINGNLTINGNITITGSQASVNAADLTVKDDIVIINAGETGIGVTSGFSGIQFARGQVSSYQLGFRESDDSLQFGPVGSTIAIADKPWVTSTIAAAATTTAVSVTGNAQPAITSVGTLTSLAVTGAVTGASFTGSGAGLTSIPNAALTNNSVTIGSTAVALGATATTLAGLTSVAATTFTGALTGAATTAGSAGTVTTAAQPNITSVGTLSSLAVTGAVTGASFTGAHSGSGAGLTSIPNSALTNNAVTIGSTSVALGATATTLAGLTSVAATTFTGALTGAATTAGTVTTAAQPAITSVGTLTSLSTSGNVAVGGTLTVAGDLIVNGTTTTINASTLDVADLNITVAKNASTAAAADGAGLTIAGANATMNYAAAGDKMVFNKRVDATSFYGSGAGLTSIPNSSLTNSSVTIGSTAIALGATSTTLAGLTSVNSASLTSTGIAYLGNTVSQQNPSATTFTTTAAVNMSGVGANYLSFGQTPTYTQWIQSGYSAASPVYYPISLNPLGGGVSIGSINAPTATLSVTGTISASGAVTGASFTGAHSGSGAGLTSIPNAALTNSSVTVTAGTGMSGGGAVSLGGTVTLNNAGVTQLTGGGGVSVSGSTGSITLGSTATSANTASAIVARDASGNFTAGTITAALTGTASNATTVGGFTPSAGSGVANRAVVADASGYISNSYFSSVDNSAASGVTAVMVKVGDNFLRSGTSAAVSTFLGLTSSATTANATINTANTLVLRDASGNFAAGVITATATTARYADLAEKYTSDAEYEPGTVVSFGGEFEVTLTTRDGDRRVAGVVTTAPAYLMNSDLRGTSVAVALQGRVPCKVTGKVKKGDMLIAGGQGYARADVNPITGQMIGKALEDFDGVNGVIEVAVGRM